MSNKVLLQSVALSDERSLKTLVENRSIFSLSHCELNVFETYEQAEQVSLAFSDLVVTSMLRGKKVMHLFDQPGFDYLPGETVVVPKGIEMKIDFPEANTHNPTQCIALAVDQEVIANTLTFLNERYPKTGENNPWVLDYQNYFFYNNIDLAGTINKLIGECMSTSITKDALADIALQELIVRLVQAQSAGTLAESPQNSNSMLGPVIDYIKNNLHENISLKDLSSQACMSTTSFYRSFKREMGMSPIEYIIREKIKHAKKLLSQPQHNVSEVSYAAGFYDYNYFIRLFKKYEGVTPRQYQMMTASV
ncbi:MAG: AraC family transcriptional regulator [Bacteroidia bacterium]